MLHLVENKDGEPPRPPPNPVRVEPPPGATCGDCGRLLVAWAVGAKGYFVCAHCSGSLEPLEGQVP